MLVGGIDLLDDALAAILQGTIHVSVGGHISDGARALLHLHDRASGDRTPLAQTTRLEAVRADEAARYKKFMKERGWRSADFTRFSARRSPGVLPPEFSLRALVMG